MTVSRRVFLDTLATTAGSLLFGARSSFPGRAPLVLRLGLVGAEHEHLASMARGAMLGFAEARRVASLLGVRVTLVRGADPQRLVEADEVHVLLGGLDESSCLAISGLAESHDVLFLNVGCTSDVLRGEQCRRRTFHVIASDAMRRDAVAAAGVTAAGSSASGAGAIVAWHPRLHRYGAAQLNDRFLAQHQVPMESAAWHGWMAVKIAWEAAARLRGFETARVIEWLEDDATRFDGHKGRALSFRPWDHQLRQPLYWVDEAANADAIVEIPAIARDGRAGVAEQLDRLGTPTAASACRWDAK